MQSSSLIADTTIPLKRGSDGGIGGGKKNIHHNTDSRQTNNNSSTHKSLAHAIIPELPVLMHGSGDVRPEHVHPHSVAVLARLVEKYVASLVSAALDAQDVFTDGQVVGGAACLGPPPFRHAMGGGVGGDEEASDDNGSDNEESNAIDSMTKKRKQKAKASARKKKAKIDYWDVPLPPPPRQASSTGGGNNTDTDSSNVSQYSNGDDDDDSDEDDELSMLSSYRRNSSSSIASTSSMYDTQGGLPTLLRGFAPVDLHANERSRNYYVAAPTVMDARSFIFPICHDAVLYQRIKEVQASRRAIHRDVVDNALLEVMREEGVKEGRRGVVDTWDAVLGSRANRIEGSNSSAASGGGSTASPGDKKKKKKDDTSNAIVVNSTTEKKKVDVNNNSKNLVVGAGLVDADVDPSWPGLNSLSRGRLW